MGTARVKSPSISSPAFAPAQGLRWLSERFETVAPIGERLGVLVAVMVGALGAL
jgi:hypothetical protein